MYLLLQFLLGEKNYILSCRLVLFFLKDFVDQILGEYYMCRVKRYVDFLTKIHLHLISQLHDVIKQ